MPQLFVNLNDARNLPGILAVHHLQKGSFLGRVTHAEIDHYTPPLMRRPPPFVHPHYHIVLVTAGEGVFEISGQSWPAAPGGIFFTSPQQSHQFLNSGNDTTRYAEVTFEFVGRDGELLGSGFAEMLSAWTNQPCESVLSRQLSRALAGVILGKIQALVNRGRALPHADNLELSALLAEILIVVFRNVFKKGASAVPDRIDHARDIIRSRYREALTIEFLAKQSGLSPSHFSRRFKARFGCAPVSYQLELRLQCACELLRTRNDSLAEIAAAVGFADVFYFSRLFRRRMGEAPGRFRQGFRSGREGR